MPFERGARLGPYEIISWLGAGGMGEVYKARDTQLGRDVAIKTLPAARECSEEQKLRLLQEARSASALNHPGIVTVYDVSRNGDVDYIVMEYVRGQTLERLIGGRGLNIQESIGYGLQIADALAKAHAAGIIHRDLKPGNIMVTDEGLIKVLDFGLAKLGEAEGVSADDVTRTIAAPAGSAVQDRVVGTAAYMSPEQAEGKKVDVRSDIFSFGAVLYEMVTGRKAFIGDSTASIMAAVLRSEPKPPTQLAESVSRDLERIILRCLRKDPARRFQHVSDLKVDLQELKETTDSGAPVSQVPERKWRRKWPWIAAAAVVLVAVCVTAWRLRTQNVVPAGPSDPVPLTSYPGREFHPSFSPDGSQVVFAWDGPGQDNFDLYVKVVGIGSYVRLTNSPAPDFDPVWSPDGRQIAFRRQGQGVLLIPAIGGREKTLIEDAEAASVDFLFTQLGLPSRCLAWSPDGRFLAFARLAPGRAGIYLIESQGGEARRVTWNEAYADLAPAFSPDGRRLAFAHCGNVSSCSLVEVEFETESGRSGPPRQLTEPAGAIGSVVWMPEGRTIVFDQSGQLSTLFSRLWRFTPGSVNKPQLLSLAALGSAFVAIARSGSRLAYSYVYAEPDLWTISGGITTRMAISSNRGEYSPQLSPDGKRITFSSTRSGRQEVWVGDVAGTDSVQLTTSRLSGTPGWSPDGKRIVYDTQTADGTWDIYLIDASGGQPVPIVRHPANDVVPSFSRDGKWVYFSSDREGRQEIYRVPVSGGEPARLTNNGGAMALESIDGSSILFTRSLVGCPPLFSMSLNGGPERQVADSVCLRGFTLAAQGIYYLRGTLGQGKSAIMLLDPDSGKSRLVSRIEGFAYLGLTVSADGKTVFFSAGNQMGADLMLVEGFR